MFEKYFLLLEIFDIIFFLQKVVFQGRVKTKAENSFLAFMGDISLRIDEFFLVQLTDGHLSVRLTPNITLQTQNRLNDDQWHHFHITLDGTSLSMYIDDEKSLEKIQLVKPVSVTSDFAYIGGLPRIEFKLNVFSSRIPSI